MGLVDAAVQPGGAEGDVFARFLDGERDGRPRVLPGDGVGMGGRELACRADAHLHQVGGQHGDPDHGVLTGEFDALFLPGVGQHAPRKAIVGLFLLGRGGGRDQRGDAP